MFFIFFILTEEEPPLEELLPPPKLSLNQRLKKKKLLWEVEICLEQVAEIIKLLCNNGNKQYIIYRHIQFYSMIFVSCSIMVVAISVGIFLLPFFCIMPLFIFCNNFTWTLDWNCTIHHRWFAVLLFSVFDDTMKKREKMMGVSFFHF